LLPFAAAGRSKEADSKIGTGLLPAVELRGFEPLTPSMRTRVLVSAGVVHCG
jgi:hypothetical protein